MPDDLPPGLIAVPAKDWVWTESAISLHHAANAAPEGSEIKFALGWSTIAKKRNELTRYALEDGSGSDYNFTLRATDAGFRLLMEPSVRPGHLGASPHDLSDAAGAVHTVPGDLR